MCVCVCMIMMKVLVVRMSEGVLCSALAAAYDHIWPNPKAIE